MADIASFFSADNQVLLDTNESLLARGEKTDKLILDYVKQNQIFIPIAPIEDEDRDGEYKIFTKEAEISKMKKDLFASEVGNDDDDPVKLVAYVDGLKDHAMKEIFDLVVAGHHYPAIVDWFLFGKALPELPKPAAASGAPKVDLEKIEKFFDASNKELTDKNYSLLSRGSKTDKLILDYVQKNGVLLSIAPIEEEDRDDEYRIFTKEAEISKMKKDLFASEVGNDDDDPVKLIQFVDALKDDAITQIKERMKAGLDYAEIVDSIVAGRGLPEIPESTGAPADEGPKIDLEKIANFFDISNPELIEKNYSLLDSSDKMDKLLLEKIKEHGILLPIAPIPGEDNEGQYKIFTKEVEINKMKKDLFASELNNEDADPVKLVEFTDSIKDAVIQDIQERMKKGQDYASIVDKVVLGKEPEESAGKGLVPPAKDASSEMADKSRAETSSMASKPAKDDTISERTTAAQVPPQIIPMQFKSLGQLESNPEATFELVVKAYQTLKEKYPSNPFIPNLKDKQITWAALVPVNVRMVQEVVNIQISLNRRTLINTGGHGSRSGDDPTDAKLGEGRFILEDINIVLNSNGKSALHIVSPGSPAYIAPNVDSLISWCYGMAELSRDYSDEESVKFLKEPQDISRSTICNTELCEDTSEDLTKALKRVKAGMMVVEVPDDMHNRCEKVYKMLSQIQKVLKSDAKADINDMKIVKDWIEWIDILQKENEPLGLIITHVDEVQFPKMSDLAVQLKLIIDKNPKGQYNGIAKQCLTTLYQFDEGQERGFWTGFGTVVGTVIGGVVGTVVTVASEGVGVGVGLQIAGAGGALGGGIGAMVEGADDRAMPDEEPDMEISPEHQAMIKKFNFDEKDFLKRKYNFVGPVFSDEKKSEYLENFENGPQELLDSNWEDALEDAAFYDDQQTEEKLKNLMAEIIHEAIVKSQSGGATDSQPEQASSEDLPTLPSITKEQLNILIKVFQSGATIKDKNPPGALKRNYGGVSNDDLQAYAQAFRQYNAIFFQKDKLSAEQLDQCAAMIKDQQDYGIGKVGKNVMITVKDPGELQSSIMKETLISKHIVKQIISDSLGSDPDIFDITEEIGVLVRLQAKEDAEIIKLLNANDRSVASMFKDLFINDQITYKQLIFKLRKFGIVQIAIQSDIEQFLQEFTKPDDEIDYELIQEILQKYTNNVRIYLQLLLGASHVGIKGKKIDSQNNFTILKYNSKELVDIVSVALELEQREDKDNAIQLVDRISKLSSLYRNSKEVKELWANIFELFDTDADFNKETFTALVETQEYTPLNLGGDDFEVVEFVHKFRIRKNSIQAELDEQEKQLQKQQKEQFREEQLRKSKLGKKESRPDDDDDEDDQIREERGKSINVEDDLFQSYHETQDAQQNSQVNQNEQQVEKHLDLSVEFCQKVCEVAQTNISLMVANTPVQYSPKVKSMKTVHLILLSDESLQFKIEYVARDKQFDGLSLHDFLQKNKNLSKLVQSWCIGWIKYPSFYQFIVQEGTDQSTLNEQVSLLGRVIDAQNQYDKSQLPDDYKFLQNLTLRFKNRCSKNNKLFREWYHDLSLQKTFQKFCYDFTKIQSRTEIDWYMDELTKINEKFPISPKLRYLEHVNKVTTRLGTDQRRQLLREHQGKTDQIVEIVIEILFGTILRKEDVSQIKNDLFMLYPKIPISERFLISFVLQQSELELRARILYYLQASMAIPLIMSCQKTFRNFQRNMKYSHEIALCMQQNEGYGVFSMGFGGSAQYQIGKTQVLNDLIFPISGSDSKAFYIKDDNLFSSGQVDIYLERSLSTKNGAVIMDGHGILKQETIDAVLELTDLLIIQVSESNLKDLAEIQKLKEFIDHVNDSYESVEICIFVRDSLAEDEQFVSKAAMQEYFQKNLDGQELDDDFLDTLFDQVQKWIPIKDMSQMGADKIMRMTTMQNVYQFYYSKLEKYSKSKEGKVTKSNFIQKFLPHDKSIEGQMNYQLITEIGELANKFEEKVNSIKGNFFEDDGLKSLAAKDVVRKCEINIREFSIEVGNTNEEELASEQKLKNDLKDAKQSLSEIDFNEITDLFWTIINHKNASLLKFEIAQRLTSITAENTKEQLLKREAILKEEMGKDLEQGKKDELIEERQKKLEEVANELYQKSISYDYFWRQMVSLLVDNPEQDKWNDKVQQDEFKKSVFQQMKNGDCFEFIDGRCLEMRADFLKEILGDIEKDKVIIAGVIGPQSTGKSTLMNYSFGTQFLASTGRCTSGIYFTLQKIPKTVCPNGNAQYLLILDTEGLQSPERADEEYDRKIVMFALLSCDLLIINARGDLNLSMAQTIKMCAVQYDKLKAYSATPNLLFTFVQNTKFDKKPFANQISNLKTDVEAASQSETIVETAQQLLGYDENKVRVLGNAFQQEFIDQDSEKGINKQNSNTICLPIFGVQASEVFDVMRDILNQKHAKRTFRQIGQYLTEAQQNWRLIEQYGADILSFADLQEYRDDQKMVKYFKDLWLKYTSPENGIQGKDIQKANRAADMLFKIYKTSNQVKFETEMNKYIQDNIEEKDKDFDTEIKGAFDTWRTLDAQKSIKYNAERKHVSEYRQKMNALKADFQVQLENKLQELKLSYTNSSGLRSITVKAKELQADKEVKENAELQRKYFDMAWAEVQATFNSQTQLDQMKVSYLNNLIKTFKGANRLLRNFEEKQKNELYGLLDQDGQKEIGDNSFSIEIKKYIVNQLQNKLWNNDAQKQFKLDHEMLKQMTEDCGSRIFGTDAKEEFMFLKRLITVDISFDTIDDPEEALLRPFVLSQLRNKFDYRVERSYHRETRNYAHQVWYQPYTVREPSADQIRQAIQMFLINLDEAGFELKTSSGMFSWFSSKDPSLLSADFNESIPSETIDFDIWGHYNYKTYKMSKEQTKWCKKTVESLIWNKDRYNSISGSCMNLFRKKTVTVRNEPNPFVTKEELTSKHKELHGQFLSEPKMKYRIQEEKKKLWESKGHNWYTINQTEELLTRPTSSNMGNDSKWRYLAGIARNNISWEKIVDIIIKIIDDIVGGVSVDDSAIDKSVVEGDEEEAIDIQKIIEMNQIDTDQANSIVNKYLNSRVVEALDKEVHQKLALHLNPEFQASFTWAAVIICWYKLMQKVQQQYNKHLERFKKNEEKYWESFQQIIQGNEQKVTQDTINFIFKESYNAFENSQKELYTTKLTNHLDSEEIKNAFKTINVYREVDKIYFMKEEYEKFVYYSENQAAAFEEYVNELVTVKIQNWIDVNIKKDIQETISKSLKNLKKRLEVVQTKLENDVPDDKKDPANWFYIYGPDGKEIDDYNEKLDLVKQMSDVFSFVISMIITGSFTEEEFEIDFKRPEDKEFQKYKFRPAPAAEDGFFKPFFNLKFEGLDEKYDIFTNEVIAKLKQYRFLSDYQVTDFATAIKQLQDKVDRKQADLINEAFDASYFSCESRVTAYKTQAVGCESKCLFCGRKCELEVHTSDVQHNCNTVGHQLRVFGGGHILQANGTKIPSLSRCDGIPDDQKIILNGERKTWKDIKEVQMAKWNIKEQLNNLTFAVKYSGPVKALSDAESYKIQHQMEQYARDNSVSKEVTIASIDTVVNVVDMTALNSKGEKGELQKGYSRYRAQDVQFQNFWKKHYKQYCEDKGYLPLEEMSGIAIKNFKISFVIDATSSMCTDIKQAKESVYKLIDNKDIDIEMRCVFYRDHCDDPPLSVFQGIGSKNFTKDLRAVRNWIDDDSINGGGAKGGGDTPECAIDGLYHESEANWEPNNVHIERMVIHIYDAPPHGDWQSGNPDQHSDHSSSRRYCCCCNTACPYNKQADRGWDKLIENFKKNNIKYQGLCTQGGYAPNVNFNKWMMNKLKENCLPVKECGKENVCNEITEIFNFSS